MAIKNIDTRIALKYDSYAAWTNESVAGQGANLVLLAGELGICHISAANQNSNVVPTVLFKVGDGTTAFKDLPWASAKAADVYSWAKASEVKRDGKSLVFVKGSANGADLKVDFDYVTIDEVKAITDEIVADVTAIEGTLETLTGNGGGSISAIAATTAMTYANDAEQNAKKYTDEQITAFDSSLGNYYETIRRHDEDVATLIEKDAAHDAKDAELTSAVATNSTAISDEANARAEADTAINNKIGTVPTGKTIVTMISDAQAAAEANAATDAQNKINELVNNGQVNTNTTNIANNASEISRVDGRVTTETAALSDRLDSVEAFFVVEEGKQLDQALDTLKEIQDYLNEEGAATGGLIDRVATNEDAIDDLEAHFATDGRVTKAEADIDSLEARATANEGNITTLQQITSGYSGANALKNAIDGVSTRAEKGITDAATAQQAADKAQDDVDDLTAVVNNTTTGLAATKGIADKAAADVAAVAARVTTNEGSITDINAVITDASKGNEKLRTDVNALQTLTGDSDKGNNALYTEVTRVAGLVDSGTTGLAVTKNIADAAAQAAETNAGEIAAIKSDYLTAADVYIFRCGTATTIKHTEENSN